jgi:hypothetical protein
VIADLITIRDRRQHLIDENLWRQNLKCKEHDYAVGHEVLIKAVNPAKLEPKAQGTYVVTQLFTNGTVNVSRGLRMVERMNICHLIPSEGDKLIKNVSCGIRLILEGKSSAYDTYDWT